jgi:hypothetical protein
VNLALQRQSLPESSSPRHQSPPRLPALVHPKVPVLHGITIQLTQAASILLVNSARARQASKVPNPIALRWVIGWGPCGESLDISTHAPLFRIVGMKLSNQIQFFQESRPTTFLHYHHHLSSQIDGKFHAVSLAHWDSPSLTQYPRRQGKGDIVIPSPIPPPPLLSLQLLMLMYQNCPQHLPPQSTLLSPLRCLWHQA